jgi:hypothetical protein
MRQVPNSKRSRGRNGRKPHQPSRSQTFDSSGPDVKVRGSASQVLEKYLALARDATASGDRIAAENYFQHAEHYYRILSANAAQNGQFGRPPQNQQQNGYNQGGPHNRPTPAHPDNFTGPDEADGAAPAAASPEGSPAA